MNLREVLSYNTDSEAKVEIDQKYTKVLATIDSLDTRPVFKSEPEYLEGKKIKGFLCGLGVYAMNSSHEATDKVLALENIYGSALERYNRRLLIKDKLERAVAKYLMWEYTYNTLCCSKVLSDAADAGLLRKGVRDVDGEKVVTGLYVVGLKFKVGDNTFSVDRKGREHRQYLETVGRQAFPVSCKKESYEIFTSTCKDKLKSIPELCESYYVTYQGDAKGCVRPIPFTSREREVLLAKY